MCQPSQNLLVRVKLPVTRPKNHEASHPQMRLVFAGIPVEAGLRGKLTQLEIRGGGERVGFGEPESDGLIVALQSGLDETSHSSIHSSVKIRVSMSSGTATAMSALSSIRIS